MVKPCFDLTAQVPAGGVVNPEFVQLIKDGDRSTDNPNSPRNVITGFYWKPPFKPAREEEFLSAALLEKMGEQKYPGDLIPSENWPNVAPGNWGPINATAPKHFNTSAIARHEQKSPFYGFEVMLIRLFRITRCSTWGHWVNWGSFLVGPEMISIPHSRWSVRCAMCLSSTNPTAVVTRNTSSLKLDMAAILKNRKNLQRFSSNISPNANALFFNEKTSYLLQLVFSFFPPPPPPPPPPFGSKQVHLNSSTKPS